MVYSNAKELLESEGDEKTYTEAASLFESIEEYKDSKELILLCHEKTEAVRKDRILKSAKNTIAWNESIKCYTEAIKNLESISGWKDADEQIEICKQKIEKLKIKAEKERQERERRSEETKKKTKKVAKIVIPIACVLIVLAVLLNSVIIPNVKYNSAVALMDAGKYTEAITAFENLDGYKDSEEQIEKCKIGIKDEKYNAAIANKNAGNIVEAYEELLALDGYKDSISIAESIYEKYKIEKIKVANVGDCIFFGSYEQDNNAENGKEDIEWLVLATDGNRKLLISKYGLDCKPYNEEYEDVTWKTCTLRKWLNEEFINSAFTKTEQKIIPTVTVTADKNPDYDTDPGKNTKDKIFLLSIDEANRYFSSNTDRQCKATEYAKGQGGYVNSDNGNSAWLLRSPGNYTNSAAVVSVYGEVSEYGWDVDYSSRVVRPALWVNLES